MEIECVTIKIPNKGDVVWAIRLPCHCGIYEGDDSVIHFAPLNGSKIKEDAVIHRSTLAEFANGSPVFVIEFPPEKCLPTEETISRARSRLDESDYNMFLNNCDHFATWCKIGGSVRCLSPGTVSKAKEQRAGSKVKIVVSYFAICSLILPSASSAPLRDDFLQF